MVDHAQASDHYFRQALQEQLTRAGEHSTRLHELLDFRAATESGLAQLEADIQKLRRQIDEKAERRSVHSS